MKQFNNIINFIKYHNAFAIGLGLVLFLTLGAFAAKDTLIGEKITTSQGIDNSYILTADLENFDFRLQIKKIEEDDENYYVSYSYQTVIIKDNIWQSVTKERTLTVSKKALGGRDLGLLVAKELGETINYDWSYLKEVQKIEKSKGLTRKVMTTQYAGLVGKLLEPKEKVFPGYVAVIEPAKLAEQSETRERIISHPGEPKPAPTPGPSPASTSGPTPETVQPVIDRELIRQIVLELLARQDVGAGFLDVGTIHESPDSEESIAGCIDSQALNFLAEATKDDGSCIYPEPEPEPDAEDESPSPEGLEVPIPETPTIETTSPSTEGTE